MSGPVVAVDVGVTSVAVSVDPGGGADPPPPVDTLDPVDVGCADGPVDLAAVLAPPDGGALVTGEAARRGAAADPGRYEPTPRARIDEGELLLGTRPVGVAEALAVVVGAALDRAGPLLRGVRPHRLVLTHPAGWGAAHREVLRRAGSGLADGVMLLEEPVAAVAHDAWMRPRRVPGTERAARGRDAGAPVAVLDLGATAVATAVVRPAPDDGTGAARFLAGRTDDEPGGGAGDDADEALLAHVVAGLRADDPARARVAEVVAGATLPDRRHRQVLVDDVRAAKERLSDAEQAPVPLPGGTTDAWLSRGELEEVLRPALGRAVALLADTVAAAGLGPDDLGGVLLIGGGARIPLLAGLVHRELGVPPTVAPDPRLVVARGALVVARSEAAARTARAAGRDAGGPVGAAATADPVPDPPAGPTPAPATDPPTDPAMTVPLALPATVPPAGEGFVWDRRRLLALLSAVAALLVAVVAGLVAVQGRGPVDPAAAPPAAGPALPADDAGGATAAVVAAFDHRYPVPAGWAPAGLDPGARRSQVRPAGAPRGVDLVAVQTDRLPTDDPAAARAAIAARYGAARAAGDPVSALDLDADFAGRPVVHYLQAPSPDTRVDWFVVLSGPYQLSVGCRHDALDPAGRDRVLTACAEVVGALRGGP